VQVGYEIQICFHYTWESRWFFKVKATSASITAFIYANEDRLKRVKTDLLTKDNKFVNASVESNSCLAVKPKNVKLSYAVMVKVTAAVEMQDRLIGNGGDPTTDLIQVEIKKK